MSVKNMGIKPRLFTPKELKAFDGKEGKPAYISFKGKVYDVSGSKFWIDGEHMNGHFAGVDITKYLVNAPHGEEVLKAFPVVGELRGVKIFSDEIINKIRRLHLHQLTVHFSISYSIGVSLMSLMYVLTDNLSFELSSYYLLIMAFLAAPVAGLTGLFSWKVTYEGRMSRIFLRKTIFTIALNVIVTVLFLWRTADPDILISGTYFSYLYLVLLASLTPIALILGYYGGRIVH